MANAKSKKGDKPDSEKPDTGQNQALATLAATQSSALSTLAKKGYVVARQVSLPTLSLQPATPRILQLLEAMRTSTYVDPDPKKAKEKPATVCACADVETGEQVMLIVPAVIEMNLCEQYPKVSPDGVVIASRDKDGKQLTREEIDTANPEGTWGYVNRAFYVEKLTKRPGKRYFDHSIIEVQPPAQGAEVKQLAAVA